MHILHNESDVLLQLISRIEDKLSKLISSLEDNQYISKDEWDRIEQQYIEMCGQISLLKNEIF